MKKFAIGAGIGIAVSLVILLPASHVVIDRFVAIFVRPYLLLEMGLFCLIVDTVFVLQTVYDYRMGYMWGSRSWEGAYKRILREEEPRKFRVLLGIRVIFLSLVFAFSVFLIVLHFQNGF